MVSATSLLAPPFLMLLCIPLTVFAVLTSIIAFSALLVRVLLVYIELGIVLTQTYFVSPADKSDLMLYRPFGSSASSSPTGHRHRRGPTDFGNTASDHVPSRTVTLNRGTLTAPPSAGLPRSEAPREFETLGGWIQSGPAEEDALWTSMNSRLELPAPPERNRRHRRSLTSGSDQHMSPTSRRRHDSRHAHPGMLSSPTLSRTRTPVLTPSMTSPPTM